MTRNLLRTAAAVLALVAASAARAEPSAPPQAGMSLSIEIRDTTPLSPEAVQAAVRAIEGSPPEGKANFNVRVRVTAEPGKGSLVQIGVGGYTIPTGKIRDAVRGASPALANADVAWFVAQAPYPADIETLVGPWSLGGQLTPAQVEEEVRAYLAGKGVQGDVKVEVKNSDADGKVRREVKVIVEK
jgi:hypothetical protein